MNKTKNGAGATPVKDITQRIAEAVARTTEPTLSAVGGRIEPGEERLGWVPPHLRHVHNLVDEVANEVIAAQIALSKAQENCKAVRTLFFNGVFDHLAVDQTKFSGMKICSNWEVVGKPAGEEDDDDIASFLGGLGGHGNGISLGDILGKLTGRRGHFREHSH